MVLVFRDVTEGVCQHEIIYDDAGGAIDYRILDINLQYETILQAIRNDVIGKLATEAYQTDETHVYW